MKKLKNLRITTKFIFWFLLVALVPLGISIYVSYNSSRRALRQEVANSLFAVADNKASQIETYLLAQKQNANMLTSMPELGLAADKFSGNQDELAGDLGDVSGECRSILQYYQRLFGYEDIFLVQPDGEIILSAKGVRSVKSLYEEALVKKSELAQVFIKAKASQDTEVSDFEYSPFEKKATCFIAAPIFKENSLIGLVIIQMGNRLLYGFTRDYTGLGKTGETILASRMGEDAVFIAPVRFDPQAEFERKIRIGVDKEGLDIQRSFLPEISLSLARDYRGHEVLAVYRYLPTFRIGMVVKMDTEEVFSSAARLRNTLLAISFTLLTLVVIMAVVIAYSISKPIKELTETSKIISSGNLSARAGIKSEDEIGELAVSFNQMTDSLIESRMSVEQKKIEVEEQKRLLEEANKELDSFVYTVSHDLRAPLRGIDGLMGFLEKDYSGKLDTQGEDYFKKIRASAKRMQSLIDDLLKLSRLSRIRNPYEDTDMNALIASVINRLEFDIKEKNVRLKVPLELPVVHCDKIKMEEAFLNLINNAIKFSSKNKVSAPCVEIGYSDLELCHQFYVKDNGIGIDKKYHEDVFGIFKRLHNQEEYEGTGAGLSIVKRIIDDHKGSIWVESELGKGATFYFTIPKGL